MTEDDRWYGVRGFFKWLESKTYKMHVRVLLSRYRAYTTCPTCNGGRFQPATLNYRIVTPPPTNGHRERPRGRCRNSPRFPICDARDFFTDARAWPPNDSTAEMLRHEVVDAAELSLRRRPRLSHARSFHAHSQRRRSAARQSHHLSRRVAREHALRHGRAERRACIRAMSAGSCA